MSPDREVCVCEVVCLVRVCFRVSVFRVWRLVLGLDALTVCRGRFARVSCPRLRFERLRCE